MTQKMTFALAFANRGFMPGELIYGAREDMIKAVTDAGYDYIAMDAELTRYGGIETRDEGLLYAKWLKAHEGQFDGVIFSMPIFADENGAITALQDAGVSKINYYTYMDKAGGAAAAEALKAIPEGHPVFFSTLMQAGREAMRKDVLGAMKVFAKQQ